MLAKALNVETKSGSRAQVVEMWMDGKKRGTVGFKVLLVADD